MFKKLKEKTKEVAASAGTLARSDSMSSLNSTNSAASSSRTMSRPQQSMQPVPSETRIRQLEAKLAERAVMIRKLEHECDKLSNQLEKSHELLGQAKKFAKENESAAKTTDNKCKTLETELNRMIRERELDEENGDLAQQESAKLKHMLLIAESENEKYKKQLESTNLHELEMITNEKEKYKALVKRLSTEIEELKVTKLDLDENVTKSKYQIENCQTENRRLKDEHNELTIERRRLVDERAQLTVDFDEKIKIITDNDKLLLKNKNIIDSLRKQLEDATKTNDYIKTKLNTAEVVNHRLKEGNFKVQEGEQTMKLEYIAMKEEHQQMKKQNDKWEKEVIAIKEEIKKLQTENMTTREDSESIAQTIVQVSSESAYFKELLEKGLKARRELDAKLTEEKANRAKAEDESISAKTSLDRLQDEYDITVRKLDEKQKEYETEKSSNISLTSQIDLLGNEVKTLMSRLEDSKESGIEDSGDGMGEAERKNLLTRAEQAEDRALTLVTEISEIKHKYETSQNSLGMESRQLLQANEDITTLKAKLLDFEKAEQGKDALLKTTQEKLRKVVTKCKTNKAEIEEYSNSISEFESKLEIAIDKYSKTREAQKLAEVKVMELEQRLATISDKHKETNDLKENFSGRLEDALKVSREHLKKSKEFEKEKKHFEQKLINSERSAVLWEEKYGSLVSELNTKDETIATLDSKVDKYEQTIRSLEIIGTDNKNSFACIQSELKKTELDNAHANERLHVIKEEKLAADDELKALKTRIENIEKSNMVLQIKLETTTAENEKISQENSKLRKKVGSLSTSISNAEIRSENAAKEAIDAVNVKTETELLMRNIEQKLSEAAAVTTRLETEILEKNKAINKTESKLIESTAKISKLTQETTVLKSDIQKIDNRNVDLEKQVEASNLEKIKMKNELNSKFESDKQQLVDIANNLENSLQDVKMELEESEEKTANHMGKIGELECEVTKHQTVSDELKIQFHGISEKYEQLSKNTEKDYLNNEKKIKSKERQVQELRKELQRKIERELVLEEADKQASNGEVLVDTNYLKHIVLRYITAKSDERKHLLRALSTILSFSPEDEKLVSDFLEYKKSWFGVSKPEPRGSIAPSIQNSK